MVEGQFKSAFKERSIYAELAKFLPLPQIIALTGLRRIWKTTRVGEEKALLLPLIKPELSFLSVLIYVKCYFLST